MDDAATKITTTLLLIIIIVPLLMWSSTGFYIINANEGEIVLRAAAEEYHKTNMSKLDYKLIAAPSVTRINKELIIETKNKILKDDLEAESDSQIPARDERTLSIIKPDATLRNITGLINAKIEKANFKIIAQKTVKLTPNQAAEFYKIHKNRAFFSTLVNSMSLSTIIVQVLQKENAVAEYRELMGNTDPKQAKPNTIRGEFGQNVQANSVHGSDSAENAKEEIKFFFSQIELLH